MAIPLATTTITVQRNQLDSTEDPADPTDYPSPEFVAIAAGVNAVISPPSASNNLVAGDRITYSARLICDPTDLKANDIVTDAVDGTQWLVLWARPIVAVGLDHTEAQLRMVSGYAA